VVYWHLADSGPHDLSRLKFANKQTSANAASMSRNYRGVAIGRVEHSETAA